MMNAIGAQLISPDITFSVLLSSKYQMKNVGKCFGQRRLIKNYFKDERFFLLSCDEAEEIATIGVS